MPSPKAAVSAAVHGAAAAVTWLQIRVDVDVQYPEGVGPASVEPLANKLPWAGLAIKVDPAGGADAQVDPQYVAIEVPKSGISFVQIVHGIKVDFATGIYRFNDAVTATDQLRFDLARLFQDVVLAQELIARNIGKPFADTFSAADVFTAQLILEKTLADTFTVADAVTKAIGLNKAETVLAVELVTKDFSKVLADVAVASDIFSAAMGIVTTLADTFTAVDAVSKSIGLNKADSVTATDAITAFTFDFARTFADIATPVEAVVKDITKGAFADSVAAVDVFSSVEAFSRSFADSAATSDSVVIAFTKGLADTVVPTELMLRTVGGKPEWNERELNVGEFN